MTVLLTLASPASSPGQTASPAPAASAAETAQEESVRRQEATIQMRRKLDQAQAAQKQNDLAGALKLYDDAFNLLQKIGGVGVEKEAQRLYAGLADVSIKLAQQAQKRGDFFEANNRMDRLLRVDPRNAAAQKYKQELSKATAAAQGRMPSEAMKAKVPEFQADQVKVNVMVQDGKVLLEAGKIAEAEKKLEQAYAADPNNTAATYYLSLAKEAKFKQDAGKRSMTAKDKMASVEEAWNPPTQGKLLPEPNVFATTNRIYTGPGRQLLMNKLERIVLDQYPTRQTDADVPLSAVLEELSELSRQRDPDKQGVNFLISSHLDRPTLAMQQQLANQGNLNQPGGFQQPIDPTTGLPTASQSAPAVILLRDLRSEVTVRIKPTLRNVRLRDVLESIEMVAEAASQPDFPGIKYSVSEFAVVFSQRAPNIDQLYNKTFKVDPNTFIQGLESVQAINPVAQFSTGGAGGGGGIGGGGGGGIGGGGGGQGQGQITGGEIPRVSVSPIIGGLSGGGGGIGGGGGGGGFGGGGGQGGGIGGQGGGGGLTAYSGLGLTAVTRQTETRTIQDYVRQFFSTATGIDFGGTNPQQNGQGGQGGQGGGGFTGGGGGGRLGGQGGGAGFGGGQGGAIPGQNTIRPLFFNDRTGVLFVRATMEELDLIEQAIQVLNMAPPQVNLEAKFVEISQEDNKGLGFQWLMGNWLMGGGSVGAQGGTAPSFFNPSAITANNPSGVFPGPGTAAGTAGPAGVAASSTDNDITSGLRNSGIPTVGTITGILTDPQFRVVINALEQRSGVDVMSAPNVTTLSGRQAQITVTVNRQILANVSAGASTTGGTTATSGAGTVNAAAQLPILQPTPVSIPTGPTLDVIPYVSADGYTVQMTMIPSILDFLGYGNPDIPDAARYEASIQAQVGNARSPIPLPRILVRQVTTSATVWDGQTVVLGGLISDDVRRTRDKVPILGDIPFLGRLFRSEYSGTAKKNLVVFVTAKIIDPAGNRVHTDDNLPYDPNTIPVQKPGASLPAATVVPPAN